MEILNHNAQKAIEYAYDNFKRDEFLERIYDYIRSTADLVRSQERMEYTKQLNENRLAQSTGRTKPGPKAKTELELT
jgi:5-methylcytosine-specific restriction endonuclease McrBC regulatory subunit McrC